jgi:Cu(I)/Ag(I) efflux system membrane protein CusA/SilA
MIERLVAWSAHNKWLTLSLIAALTAVAWHAMRTLPVDAIPDLSDTQVIIYSQWDRSPDVLEAQVTYPVIQALLGAPRVKTIRGFSDFGVSYVYVIFEDGTDLYWARSRVVEYLSKLQGALPAGVRTELGPDATGVGWVYQYALVDRTGKHDLSDLRSLQDFNLKYQLQSVPGVAEVASVGGFVKQLQVTVDPARLQAYNVGILDVLDAVRASNSEMGARLVEFSGAEFMVRGHGWVKGPEDVEEAPVRLDEKTGTPVRVKDVAKVAWGPDLRRGVSELDGQGEAVGGIIVMRQGENAPAVIDAVKQRLAEIKPSLPPGVELVTVYDRSDLIHRAIHTITHELLLEMLIVSLVILLFLWHIPSALIPILTLPVAVLLAFIPMRLMGVSANIMSLAGIAVAIGAMVDASVVVVENSHKKLELWAADGGRGDYKGVLIKSIQEVARPSFFSLLVIAVSFLPVFALVDQEGRLFRPLALTKTFSMLVAGLLAITMDPALRLAIIRLKPFTFSHRLFNGFMNTVFVGKLHKEEHNPISRFLFGAYRPVVDWVLDHPGRTLAGALLALALTVPVYLSLGSEFMPNLDEGDLLYMPTALPGLSVTEATRVLQRQDQIIASFPQVEHVFGKSGRAETSTDVAPFSMVETTIKLKPKELWPEKPRWYSPLPGFLKPLLRWAWPDRQTTDEVADAMNARLRFAGIPNIWTMPIRNRLDMLSTGVRTPIGIKVLGSDLKAIEGVAIGIERTLKGLKGTRNVFAERAAGGYFLDVDWDRRALARYGLSVEQAQMQFGAAVGGDNVTTLVLGRERYGVNVRYARDFRDDMDAIKRVQLTPGGMPGQGRSSVRVCIGQVAQVRKLEGPAMIRDEGGLLAGYVYVDVAGRDLGGYVDEAKARVAANVKLPPGVSLRYSGQVENMQRVAQRMAWMIPLTLALVFGLILLNTHSITRTAIILLAVPFSVIGAVLLLKLLGYNLSVAVWVGMIALAGLDAETGIFMLLFLELSHGEMKAAGRMNSLADLREAVQHGAVKRVRPKIMTVACAFTGLLPILFSTGSGADVMKRIAAPMLGGLFSSFALELLVYPAVYYLWRAHGDGLLTSSNPWVNRFWRGVARVG